MEAIFQGTCCGAVELLNKGRQSISLDARSWKRNPWKSRRQLDQEGQGDTGKVLWEALNVSLFLIAQGRVCRRDPAPAAAAGDVAWAGQAFGWQCHPSPARGISDPEVQHHTERSATHVSLSPCVLQGDSHSRKGWWWSLDGQVWNVKLWGAKCASSQVCDFILWC